MKRKSLDKEKKLLKRRAGTLLFFAIVSSIIVFILTLLILEKYFLLGKEYLYLISFIASLLIVLPVSTKKLLSLFTNVFLPIKKIEPIIDSMISGNFNVEYNPCDDELLGSFTEKISVLTQTLRENFVTLKDSLLKIEEVVKREENEEAREKLSSLLRDIEESFKIE